MTKPQKFEFLGPVDDQLPTEGQACMRSTRMQADLISIAAHRLTPEQQQKLRSIAEVLQRAGKVDTKLFEEFRTAAASVTIAEPPVAKVGLRKASRKKSP